jgi:hypothetical protein
MRVWLQEIKNHAVSFLIVFLPIAWLLVKLFGGIAAATVVSAMVYMLGIGVARILLKKNGDT